MEDTRKLFDFSNEGDCVLASEQMHQQHEALTQHEQDEEDTSWTFTMLDLLASLPEDLVCSIDTPLTDEELDSFKNHNEKKSIKIKPYIVVNDLNCADDDPVNSIKPKPAVEIGITGEF